MNLQDWEIVTDWYEHDPDMNEDERLETENAVRASIEHLIRVEGVIPSQGDFIADFSGKLHGAEINGVYGDGLVFAFCDDILLYTCHSIRKAQTCVL